MALNLQNNATATVPFACTDQTGTPVVVTNFLALPIGVVSAAPSADGGHVVITPLATAGSATITVPGQSGQLLVTLTPPAAPVNTVFTEAAAVFAPITG